MNEVYAEGGCPPGYYPYPSSAVQGQPAPQGCAPIPGYNNQQQAPTQPHRSPPQWANQWGAVATDGPAGILGATTNSLSQSEAERIAIADCQTKGGQNCKVDVSYGNQCAAVVVGSMGYAVNPGINLKEAIQKGMKTCSEGGATNCLIYYSACSLPVRIR
ncbi:MAG TPA: DUF4189 domain-containing protein [Rhodanobacter sp.]|nr:DUF4189 domain-containing protein [Rhodanobacter sp.]